MLHGLRKVGQGGVLVSAVPIKGPLLCYPTPLLKVKRNWLKVNVAPLWLTW